MKINANVRLKSPKFWLFLIGFAGALASAILPRLGVNVDISGWEGFADDLVTVVFLGLTGLGIVVDPTTPSLSDSKQAMGYQVKSKNQLLQEQVDELTEQLGELQAGNEPAQATATTTTAAPQDGAQEVAK